MKSITPNQSSIPTVHYNDYDMQLAESILQRLAVLDINAGDLRGAIRFVMAKHVGGDMAFAYSIDSTQTYLTICDGVGHGVASCLIAAFIHIQVLNILQNKPVDLQDFLQQLNDDCYSTFHELPLFATYAVVKYDHSDGTCQIATCGHPPVIVLKSDGVPAFYSTPYPPLGLFPSLGSVREVRVHTLEKGDRIVLYTDGILEAKDTSSGNFFGKERFMDLLVQYRHLPDSDLAELIISKVKDFVGQELQDDITCMVVSRRD